MSDLVWRLGDELASDIEWLDSVAESSASGWEPLATAFEDRIWVLHPWYERQADGSQGQRVLWRDVWSRHGLTLGEGMAYPPCLWWIVGPGADFQSAGPFADEHVITPHDGWMEAGTLLELSRRLPAGDHPLIAVWDTLSGLSIPSLRESNPQAVVSAHVFFADLVASPEMTPNNIWPWDRSWLTWTDYDLWATEVHGGAELIAALEAAPELETLRWTAPGVEG